MIKQDGFKLAFKGGFHEPPHILVAAEAMGKYHGPVGRSVNMDIISFDYAHNGTFDRRLPAEPTTPLCQFFRSKGNQKSFLDQKRRFEPLPATSGTPTPAIPLHRTKRRCVPG